LVADTAALKSGGCASDGLFTATQARLAKLLRVRDDLATRIKNQLFRAAFASTPSSGLICRRRAATRSCRRLRGFRRRPKGCRQADEPRIRRRGRVDVEYR